MKGSTLLRDATPRTLRIQKRQLSSGRVDRPADETHRERKLTKIGRHRSMLTSPQFRMLCMALWRHLSTVSCRTKPSQDQMRMVLGF